MDKKGKTKRGKPITVKHISFTC